MPQPFGSGTSVKFTQTTPQAATFHGVVESNVMTVYFPSSPPGTHTKREYVWNDALGRWESANPNMELFCPSGPGSPPPYTSSQGGVPISGGTCTAVA